MSLVPASGSSKLAALLRGHTDGAVGRLRAQGELATVVGLANGKLGIQPDSWTAAPFGPGNFWVIEPLMTGLIETVEVEVPETQIAGGQHGGHTGGDGSHDHGVHEHALHKHPLDHPIIPLQAGDRVVMLWIGPTPFVIGRIRSG
jgi:hypothetical protein